MGLFSSSHTSAPLADWNPPCWYNHVNEEEAASIDYPVTDEEISTGLQGLKPFKAPGPDGLHTSFFQRFWLVVGNLVKEEVKSIFSSGNIPGYMNETLITLIPKCKNPESFNNYRPINLCNTIYKVVTKDIVARLLYIKKFNWRAALRYYTLINIVLKTILQAKFYIYNPCEIFETQNPPDPIKSDADMRPSNLYLATICLNQLGNNTHAWTRIIVKGDPFSAEDKVTLLVVSSALYAGLNYIIF